MSVELACPACAAVNAFTDEQSGRMGKCGQCHTPLYIPRREEMPAFRTSPRGGGGISMVKILIAAAALVFIVLVGTAALGVWYIFVYPRGDGGGNSTAATGTGTGKDTKDPYLTAPVVKVEAARSVTQEGAVEQAGGEAIFKFSAPASGTMLVYVDPTEGSKLDGHLFALDSQKKEIAQNDTDADRRVSMIQFAVTSGQDGFVKVTGFDGTTGKFKLRFQHVTSVPSDVASAVEVRLTKAGTSSQTWRLERADDINIFRLVAPFSGSLTVTMAYPSGSTLDGMLNFMGSGQQPLFLPGYVEKGSTYYLKVSSWNPPLDNTRTRTGAYTLNLKLDKTSAEPGRDFASANKVNFSGGQINQPGQIKTEFDAVYFTFTAPKTGQMQIDVLPDGLLDPEFYVYDSSKNQFGAATNGTRFFDPFVTQGFTYYVKVVGRQFPAPGLTKTGTFSLQLRMDSANGKDLKEGKAPEGAKQVALDANGSADLNAQFLGAGDKGWYQVRPNRDGLLVVEYKLGFNSKLAAKIESYNSALGIAGAGNDQLRELLVTSGKTYYVRVIPYDNPGFGMDKTGTFDLSFRTETIQPDDFGNDFTSAYEMKLAGGFASVTGRIEVPSDVDFFRVRAPDDGWLTVSLTVPPSSRLDSMLNAYEDGNPRRDVATPYLVAEKGKDYYFKVSAWSIPLFGKRLTGDYALSVTFSKTLPDDYGNDFATAHSIFLDNYGALVMGRIETKDDVDFFSFKAKTTGQVEVVVRPSLGGRLNSHLYVYNDSKGLISDTSSGTPRLLLISVEDGKTYYVKVASSQNALPSEARGCYEVALRPIPKKTNGQLQFQNGVAAADSQLTTTDPFDKARTTSYSKVFTVALTAGTKYQIDMTSTQLDCYLRLENSSMTQLATDNGSGGNLNARLVFDCTTSGTYRLIATTFDGGVTGSFSVKVQMK
jgi:hypothetical protein